MKTWVVRIRSNGDQHAESIEGSQFYVEVSDKLLNPGMLITGIDSDTLRYFVFPANGKLEITI